MTASLGSRAERLRCVPISRSSPKPTTNSRAREIDGLVYDKLRRLAAFHLRGELRAHAFDPTDLVSEVYLRLAGARLEFTDQAHFFAVASRSLRRILVDHARKQCTAKRGSGGHPVEFDEADIATDRPRELVALGDALEELVRFDERKARVTALRYFGGLTHDEIATVCGIHANTVSRDLRLSEVWLRGRCEA
jgi:RNA polymerase sigma factor (TIGR02999 family)